MPALRRHGHQPRARPGLAIALGAHVETGIPGAALMIVLGTLLGIVTFGALTANLALRTKDAAAVQAILPMAYLLIFLTSVYQQPEQIDSPVMRTIVDLNPAEHVLRPMRELMLSDYDWSSIEHRARVRGDRRARPDRDPAHRPQLPIRLPVSRGQPSQVASSSSASGST